MLEQINIELKNLEDNLNKEKRDVDNLKKISLSNLISTVKGNKEEKIEKEEREYVMAKVKYDQCLYNIGATKAKIEDITKTLMDLSKYENEYANLLKKKIELINIYSDETTKNKIINMEQKIDSYLKEIQEIEESIYVGNRLMSEILEAKKLLNSAENWSTLDIFGGGLISSMAKHSKIDDAQRQFSRISNLIKSFNKELKDVNLNGVSFSSTTKTFDIFFDNIFSDLAVNKHITESYKEVCNLEANVENILRNLSCNKEKLYNQVDYQKREYDEFIKSI